MKASLRYSGTVLWSVVICVLLLAIFLRFDGLADRPLTIDEATIASFVEGVWERGYPFIFVSTIEVPLATYELVPYFLTFSTVLGEFNDFYLRLPAVLFSLGTLVIIFWICYRQFNVLAGVIASLIYAVSTWAIYWAQNCFHPSQTQFFTLLTIMMVRRLLNEDQVKLSTAILLALTFSVTYISWEGSGFLLPVSALMVLIFRRQQLSWLFQRNLWVMYLLVLLTLVLQGVRRIFLQEPHLMVGSGKGDVSLPQLGFLKDGWDPMFYLINFFGMEIHYIVGAIYVLGVFYFVKRQSLQFYYLYFLMMIFCLSNFLLFYNAHYLFFIYPLFVISVGVIMSWFVQDVIAIARKSGSAVVVALSAVSLAGLICLTVASLNTNVLKFYETGNKVYLGQRYDYRDGIAGVDYRTISEVFRRNYRKGDAVISGAPMPTKIYSGIMPDYFLQTITDRKVVYDPNLNEPFYRDKFLGTAVLRSGDELRDMLSHHQRVWMLAAPWEAMVSVVDQPTIDFVTRNMKVVAESYDARLYLWER